MNIPDWANRLFKVPNAKKWLTRSRLPKANALLPLSFDASPEKDSDHFLYSLDPRCLRLTEQLSERLNREFPLDVLPNGFAGPTGVGGDFNALRNVSGYGMNPMPIPVTDNSALLAKYNLADKIRPHDTQYLDELIRLFFGHASPCDLHIRKEGSTSFPFFTKDIQYKKLGALKALRECDTFLKLATGGKSFLQDLLDQYHSVFLFAIHERQQPDSVSQDSSGRWSSKDRTAPTEDEARSGNYNGTTVADKTVKDMHGNVVEGHFAMRRRDVFGMCGIINYFLTAIIGCFREVYLNRFAFTFKTRDRFDKQEKISKYKYVVGSDVKTMDKTIPKWFLDYVIDKLPTYLDERVVEVMRRAYQAPFVVPPPFIKTSETYDPMFGGDPMDPASFKQHVGLPSGVAFNPDWGKLWMSFVYIVLYRDVGAIYSASDIEPLLRGLNKDHALLDMSDDAAFLTNSAVTAAKFAKPTSPYAILEVEMPVVFLGDVFCDVGGEKRVYPNPITYMVNIFGREDSVDRLAPSTGNSVIAWAEGVMARRQTYSSTPIFRDMNAIYEEECRKHLGVNPNLIAATMARRQRLSDIDAMVRANPAVLYYKVDAKDVSPAVLDEVVATIPAVDFFSHIRHLFKVPVTTLE